MSNYDAAPRRFRVPLSKSEEILSFLRLNPRPRKHFLGEKSSGSKGNGARKRGLETLNAPTTFQAHRNGGKKTQNSKLLLLPGPVPPAHGPRPGQRAPARARGADASPAGTPPPAVCQNHGRDPGRPPIRLPGETAFFFLFDFFFGFFFVLSSRFFFPLLDLDTRAQPPLLLLLLLLLLFRLRLPLLRLLRLLPLLPLLPLTPIKTPEQNRNPRPTPKTC